MSVNQIRCRHSPPVFCVTYRTYPTSDALLSLNTGILAICPLHKNRKPFEVCFLPWTFPHIIKWGRNTEIPFLVLCKSWIALYPMYYYYRRNITLNLYYRKFCSLNKLRSIYHHFVINGYPRAFSYRKASKNVRNANSMMALIRDNQKRLHLGNEAAIYLLEPKKYFICIALPIVMHWICWYTLHVITYTVIHN